MSFPSNTPSLTTSEHTTTNVVSPSLADVLRAAARYLTRHGWTQGAFYANTTAPHPQACALGAIAIAATGEIRDQPVVEDDSDPCWPAIKAFSNYLYHHSGHTFGHYIDHWNDHPERTQTEVITALHHAADQLERSNHT